MAKAYQSSIPVSARERTVERHTNGKPKRAEYLMARKVVGVRGFFESGEPEYEYALKNGMKHGTQYHWLAPGHLLSAEPFVEGRCHGTARQWDERGRLVGTYTMEHGTGIDLWWNQRSTGRSWYLSEVLYCKEGMPNGFEWWIDEDQRSVYIEQHWRIGQFHGIAREWNLSGRLHRGFPAYFIDGKRVTKRQYLRASQADPSLPPFRPKDNRPARQFSPEIAQHLRFQSSRKKRRSR